MGLKEVTRPRGGDEVGAPTAESWWLHRKRERPVLPREALHQLRTQPAGGPLSEEAARFPTSRALNQSKSLLYKAAWARHFVTVTD